jgi:hypothetical protein
MPIFKVEIYDQINSIYSKVRLTLWHNNFLENNLYV